MRALLISASILVSAMPGLAGDPPKFPLSERFAAICSSKARLSPDLSEACRIGEAPAILKDGSRFKNIGIGTEANTIWENIELINS